MGWKGTPWPKWPEGNELFVILLTARQRTAEDTENVSLDIDTVAPNNLSLPAVLKILVEGTGDQKIRLILDMHRQNYHKPADTLKAVLNKAGVPIRVLALVVIAIALCPECRAHARGGAKPHTSLQFYFAFNERVGLDLVFYDEFVFLLFVDYGTRFSRLWALASKEEIEIERAFRRAWAGLFGRPQETISDMESAVNSDRFGVYLENLGTKRLMIKAKEDHEGLGVINRRAGLFQRAAPVLHNELAKIYNDVEPEDLASEIEMAMNTVLTFGGQTPYACLLGVDPGELSIDEPWPKSHIDADHLSFYPMLRGRLAEEKPCIVRWCSSAWSSRSLIAPAQTTRSTTRSETSLSGARRTPRRTESPDGGDRWRFTKRQAKVV
jgi:hypothetical protein